MNRNIIKILKQDEIESKVVSILLANNMVKLVSKTKGMKYTNCKLTKESRELLDEDAPVIPDDWMKKYRGLFPSHRRASPAAIKSKMEKFFTDHGSYSLDDIYRAAELYMKELQDTKFCIQADNFFYKYDPDRSFSSTCLQYLDLLEEKDNYDGKGYSGTRMI